MQKYTRVQLVFWLSSNILQKKSLIFVSLFFFTFCEESLCPDRHASYLNSVNVLNCDIEHITARPQYCIAERVNDRIFRKTLK